MQVVEWDSIKDNPPAELKISPIAAIPHKSKAFRSILDLSFHLCTAQKWRLQVGGPAQEFPPFFFFFGKFALSKRRQVLWPDRTPKISPR